MRIIGYGATTLALVFTVGVIALGVSSVPDVRRYLRIRSM